MFASFPWRTSVAAIVSLGEEAGRSGMPREKHEKAMRYLLGGRLRVVKVDGAHIEATCRSDKGNTYRLGYDPLQQRWSCSCPARVDCAHLGALWAVVDV